jgi:peptidoglycan/LPS O-acetylase OafA/YrhL
MSEAAPLAAASDTAAPPRTKDRSPGASPEKSTQTLPQAPTTRRHLYEIDVLRILTFACVIAVHTTSHTVAADDWGLNGLLALVHFTREVFFALTAFVLVYSYRHKPVPMRKFWPRRFLLVGVPYLVWSAIYVLIDFFEHPSGGVGHLLTTYLVDVITGNAWYHMYFLLVTMQVYLLLPLIQWFVRITRKHHWTLLAISFVVELVIMALYMYWPSTVHWLGVYSNAVFLSYQFFILLGAVGADHATEFLAWVRSHRGVIAVIAVLSGLFMLGVFVCGVLIFGFSQYHAGTPMQPAIVVWSVGIGLGFLALGTKWADTRRPDSLIAKAVDYGSDRSFGIFLSHPLFIWFILWVGGGWVADTIAKPWLTLVVYVAVVIGAVLLTDLLRRTPLSLAFTGRPRSRQK